MWRSWWFTLVLGLAAGFLVGYMLGESQPIKPSSMPAPPQMAEGALPEGHPPIGNGATAGMSGMNDMSSSTQGNATAMLERRIAELEQMAATDPDNLPLLITLGDRCFDAMRWDEARTWYERAIEKVPDNPHVLTDLAVVYRNLDQPERSLDLLNRAIEVDPALWQAWFNKALILHDDLDRVDEAEQAMEELERLRTDNPVIPDPERLRRTLEGRKAQEAQSDTGT
jgi:hypothetical protein